MRKEEKIQKSKIHSNPFISILCPIYNEPNVVERLLTNLRRLDYPHYEVIVIDDSDDGVTSEKLRLIASSWGAGSPQLKVLHRGSREGWKGGALNYALNSLDPRSEAIVVFDADFVPPKDILRRMSETLFSSDERYAALQGYQRHSLNSLENILTRIISASFCACYKVVLKANSMLGSFVLLTGSVMMIKVNALKKVGGFSPSLVEDLELTYRLMLNGYKVLYTDQIYAEGECPSTFRRFLRQQRRWAEGTIREARRYFTQLLSSRNLSPIEKVTCLIHIMQFAMPLVITVHLAANVLLHLFGVLSIHPLVGSLILLYTALAPSLILLVGSRADRLNEEGLIAAISYPLFIYLLLPLAWAVIRGLALKRASWIRTFKTGKVTVRGR
jgi:cellulose synthase/poly-beta-1,6-N-acetylglucosamine synthase-like glycosyltransferase